MDKAAYKKHVEERASKSTTGVNCLRAFLVGGTICVIGQGFMRLFVHLGSEETTAKTLVALVLMAIAAILTGLGLYSKLAKFGMAGAFVPITGFANAITSSAIESKTEGWIFGMGAKIFTIAGPVILYGTLASVLYGVIYYVVTLWR